MSAADAILDGFDGKSNARIVLGYFRGLDGLRAIVDFGDGRVPADLAMGVLPEINDAVFILLIDGKAPLVFGWTVPKPGQGTVTSVDGDFATVHTDLGDVVAPFGFTVSEGDLVKLYWNDGPFIISPMSTTPTPGVDPGAPGGGGGSFAPEFAAIDSGSWRGGRYWTPFVRAGDTNLGVWIQGTKIRDTVPANAVIDSLEIWSSPSGSPSGSAPIFALHTLTSLSGPPAFGPQTAVPVPSSPNWVPLPTSWGDLLKAGGGYYGVGVNHGGNTIFNSLAADGRSGALRIRYHT